jgi:hypothetical protein
LLVFFLPIKARMRSELQFSDCHYDNAEGQPTAPTPTLYCISRVAGDPRPAKNAGGFFVLVLQTSIEGLEFFFRRGVWEDVVAHFGCFLSGRLVDAEAASAFFSAVVSISGCMGSLDGILPPVGELLSFKAIAHLLG